jgi:hypothetical protein
MLNARQEGDLGHRPAFRRVQDKLRPIRRLMHVYRGRIGHEQAKGAPTNVVCP